MLMMIMILSSRRGVVSKVQAILIMTDGGLWKAVKKAHKIMLDGVAFQSGSKVAIKKHSICKQK